MNKISWLRVAVGVNVGMTALLFYFLFELHRVVEEELGLALVFYSTVLQYVVGTN